MILIWGGIILVIVLVVAIGWYMDKKRTEAIENLAESLGLEFVGKCTNDELGTISNFKLFQSGHSRSIKNLLQGETDIAKIQIFDYSYSTGSGKNKSTYRQTVVTMVSNEIQAPQFDLSPEGFFSKISEWFGANDIDFDDHQEFSDAFQLFAMDEEAIREYFDHDLMDFFCQRKGQNVSVYNGELVFYRARVTASPDEWKNLMAEGFSVYQAILDRQSR